MPLKVKNPSLQRRVFRTVNRYLKLASQYYRKGDMKKGKKYEKMADSLYKRKYYKIFEVVK